jgi:serine/threonine protein kinase
MLAGGHKIIKSLTEGETLRKLHRFFGNWDGSDSTGFNEKFVNSDPLAMDLFLRMTRLEPEKRITAEESLRHPYLAKKP